MGVIGQVLSTEPYRSYGPWKDCPTVYQIFGYAGIDGRISERRRRKIDAHLQEGCKECRQAIDQLTQLHADAKNSAVSDECIESYLEQLRRKLRY